MLTNNEIKYYSSLLQKKFRQQEKKFIFEGLKIVEEGLNSDFKCEVVLLTHAFVESNHEILSSLSKKKIRAEVLKEEQFRKLSDTESPQGIAAVFNFFKPDYSSDKILKENLIIYLDNISDPGNLGTIIRTADWFGVKIILLSPDCVELYNPKVIRASMGSIFHLDIIEDFRIPKLKSLSEKFKIILTDTFGKNLYEVNFPENKILVFSNEGNGPSLEIQEIAYERITIPKYGNAESLNVASAAAVVLSQILGTN
ncbi:MAG: RNA methyltransferase [Ignavibacteriales bacterium]|nr:MAG: RNA methyltransferase [Ignavibacteriales bacterium]